VTTADTDDFSTVLEKTADAGSTTAADTADTLTGATSLSDIFQEAADTYGVDVNLLTAIAKQESGFDASATSSCGAQGIMQLMPATAQSLGVTDAYDPYENIMGGAKLISQLLNQYDGDVSLALAAYNAGSGNVAKYGGIPPFAETQNYVAKVTAYYQEGVTVPDITYTDDSLSKEETAVNLEALLSGFPQHSSYSVFLEQMELLTAAEDNTDASDTTDAEAAYTRLLRTANQAIINMLQQTQRNAD
jgi:hypothetical protein